MRSSRLSSASSNSAAAWSSPSASQAFDRGVVQRPFVARLRVVDDVQRADVGAVRGDLEEQVAEQEAGEGPVRRDGRPVGEALGDSSPSRNLSTVSMLRSGGRSHGASVGREATSGKTLRVRERHPTYAVGEPLQEVLPAVARRVEDLLVDRHLVEHGADDGVQQVLATRDVAVQRHRFHAEHGAQAAHGESGEPELVDEGDGRGHDAGTVQWLPGGPAACGRPPRPRRRQSGSFGIGLLPRSCYTARRLPDA